MPKSSEISVLFEKTTYSALSLRNISNALGRLYSIAVTELDNLTSLFEESEAVKAYPLSVLDKTLLPLYNQSNTEWLAKYILKENQTPDGTRMSIHDAGYPFLRTIVYEGFLDETSPPPDQVFIFPSLVVIDLPSPPVQAAIEDEEYF